MSKDDFDADKKAPTDEDLSGRARRWNAGALKRIKPLRSFPFAPHPTAQARMDEYSNRKSYVPPPVQSGPEEFWEVGEKKGT